jgi:hypothetical protein
MLRKRIAQTETEICFAIGFRIRKRRSRNTNPACPIHRRVDLDPKQAMALALHRRLGPMGDLIMVRFVQLRLAAVPLVAAAIIASSSVSGWAFSQQTLTPPANGNYNFNYSDPDHPATNGLSTLPSDPNGPGFHFSIEQGQTAPFSGFQSGNHSFGNGNNPTSPGYYIQRGNGD